MIIVPNFWYPKVEIDNGDFLYNIMANISHIITTICSRYLYDSINKNKPTI